MRMNLYVIMIYEFRSRYDEKSTFMSSLETASSLCLYTQQEELSSLRTYFGLN